MEMNTLLAGLTGMTGDNGRPLLVAICLIVSIALVVVLIVLGRNDRHTEDEGENEPEDGRRG